MKKRKKCEDCKWSHGPWCRLLLPDDDFWPFLATARREHPSCGPEGKLFEPKEAK